MRLLLMTINPHGPGDLDELSLSLVQTAPIYRGVALLPGQLTLVATGGSGGYTYTVAGLPAGLTMPDASTGIITGTPTTIAHTVITASAVDSDTNSTGDHTFSINVLTRLSWVSNFPPPTIEVGNDRLYQFSILGATGTISFALTGTYADSSITTDGLLTLSASAVGALSYTVTAADSGTGDTISVQCTTNVIAAYAPSGTNVYSALLVGVPVTIDNGMVGGTAPYSYFENFGSCATTTAPENSSSAFWTVHTTSDSDSLNQYEWATLTDGTNSIAGPIQDVFTGFVSWSAGNITVTGDPTLIPIGTQIVGSLPPGLDVQNFPTQNRVTLVASQPFDVCHIGNYNLNDGLGVQPAWQGFNVFAYVPGQKLQPQQASVNVGPAGPKNLNVVGGHVTNDSTTATIVVNIYGVAAGTDTYTLTPSPALDAYFAGLACDITFTNANTGASTLNISGLGAVDIELDGAALTAGQLPAGSTRRLVHDGTAFQVEGGAGGSGGGGGPPYGVASGTDTYAVTLGLTSYVVGKPMLVKFTNANTTTATLDADSLGALDIYEDGAPLVGGEIPALSTFALVYNGLQLDLIGAVPAPGGSGVKYVEANFDGNGVNLRGTPSKQIPTSGISGTITGWTIVSDPAGSGTIVLATSPYQTTPAFMNLVTASISAAFTADATGLTGSTINAGDIVKISGSGFSAAKSMSIIFEVTP